MSRDDLAASKIAAARKPLAFLGVGAASALVDAGAFSLLFALGVRAAGASALGFLAAFAVNYSGNRVLVFRVSHRRTVLVRYLALVAVNLALSTGIVAALVAVGTEAHVAKVCSMIVIVGLNYVVMGAWVFRADHGEA